MVQIKGKYPKHFLLIRNELFELGNNFTISESLDTIYNSLNFDLPFFETESWTTKNLSRYDTVQLYFKFYETAEERDSARLSTSTPELSELDKIFDGYIDRIELSQSKGIGFSYKLYCKSTMGLTYERSTQVKFFSSDINTMLDKMLSDTNLTQYVDNIYVNGIRDGKVFKIESTVFLGDVLDQIKQDYAIQIYQNKSSDLFITTPSYFNIQNLEAYEYDVEDNVFDIDYGDITQAVDTVVVVGTNTVGVAFDPIAYQLKYGTKIEDIDTTIAPDPDKLNIRFIYRRDLYDQESCQEIAREKLVEFAKNFTITFSTLFIPTQQIGENFIIKNSPKIPDTQLWTIKNINTNISKTDIKCQIIGYSNSVTDFPDDILLSSSGILDTDILGVTDKVEASLDIRG